MGKDEELQRKLLNVFSSEAEERLQSLTSGLLELEKGTSGADRTRLLESIYMDAHSLKGAARSVGRSDTEEICQALESLLFRWKMMQQVPSAEVFDSLYGIIEGTKALLDDSVGGRDARSAELAEQLEHLEAGPFRQVPADREPTADDAGASGREESEAPVVKQAVPGKSVHAETVRIGMAKLDSILRQVEELMTVKMVTAQRAGELRRLKDLFDQWQARWSGISGCLDSTAGRVTDFLLWQQNMVRLMEEQLEELFRKAEEDCRLLGRRVDNLLEDTKKVMLFPVSSILQAFPKMVRDLCREQDKEADLVVRGDEIEVDKRILEEMKDPLIHLVRNSIDHGLENPEEREKQKKKRRGTVVIAVSPVESDKVEISVRDDGAGIDRERVKAEAVKRGLISREEAEEYPDQEALSLIFQSDLSTSDGINRISGRGLGMAIVQERVEKIGGSVSVETGPSEGTVFRIVLPLTLATFRGVLLRAGEHLFIVPTMNVERVGKIRSEEIGTVENRKTLTLRDRTISMVALAEVLEIPVGEPAPRSVPYIILGTGSRRIAFSVQEILTEEEVLVKGLGQQLARVRNIGGATVLGSGRVVPVLNVSDLLKSACKAAGRPDRSIRAAAAEEDGSPRRVLVVEDSITSRMLLKNILESAEYQVDTAVDGFEAFSMLKVGEFDLVVSDIEMPRMDGFELTSRIRNEKHLEELPVVLVTALENREDRERGIDVGADAYIVKSNFDQSNLLKVVGRLL